MSTQYDGDDDELRDWVDLIDRKTNRPSEYYHHPPKPWLREEALKAAYYAYEAAYKEASEIAAVAIEAAYVTYNAEKDRINKEYPQ